MMRLILILFFIQVHKIYLTEGRKFIWKPVTSIRDRKSWRNENSPCADSVVSFEKNKLTVLFVEKGFAAKEVLLPDDGILYFDQYTLLGETPDWQCEFSKEGKDGRVHRYCSRPLSFYHSSVILRISSEPEYLRSTLLGSRRGKRRKKIQNPCRTDPIPIGRGRFPHQHSFQNRNQCFYDRRKI